MKRATGPAGVLSRRASSRGQARRRSPRWAAGGGAEAAPLLDDGLRNPCLDSRLPERLARHEIVERPGRASTPPASGTCTSTSWVTATPGRGRGFPRRRGVSGSLAYIRRLTLMNAGCVNPQAVDRSYVDRLLALVEVFPPGARCLLLAFDYHHDADGPAVPTRSSFHVPDQYAAGVAERFRIASSGRRASTPTAGMRWSPGSGAGPGGAGGEVAAQFHGHRPRRSALRRLLCGARADRHAAPHPRRPRTPSTPGRAGRTSAIRCGSAGPWTTACA